MPEIRYSKDHEYIRVEGSEGVVGMATTRSSNSGTWSLLRCRRLVRR